MAANFHLNWIWEKEPSPPRRVDEDFFSRDCQLQERQTHSAPSPQSKSITHNPAGLS